MKQKSIFNFFMPLLLLFCSSNMIMAIDLDKLLLIAMNTYKVPVNKYTNIICFSPARASPANENPPSVAEIMFLVFCGHYLKLVCAALGIKN